MPPKKNKKKKGVEAAAESESVAAAPSAGAIVPSFAMVLAAAKKEYKAMRGTDVLAPKEAAAMDAMLLRRWRVSTGASDEQAAEAAKTACWMGADAESRAAAQLVEAVRAAPVPAAQLASTGGGAVASSAAKATGGSSDTPAVDADHALACIEEAVRLSFIDRRRYGAAADETLQHFRPLLEELERLGRFGFEPEGRPEVYIPVIFHQLSKFVLGGGTPAETIRAASRQARLACDVFRTAPCRILQEELVNVVSRMQDGDTTPADVAKFLASAAESIPLAFPETSVTAIRREMPTYGAPQPVPVYVPIVGTTASGPQETATPSSILPGSSGHANSIDVDSFDDILAPGSSGRAAVPDVTVGEALAVRDAQTRPPSRAARTMAGVLSRPPAAVDAKRLRHDPWDVLTSPDFDRTRPPQPTADAATDGAALPLGAPTATHASVAAATMATTTRSAQGAAVPISRYPCRSRYHNKYADPKKHASRDCPYCVVCHMMEFVFNGCVHDCIWGHRPTSRKLSLHLAAHPTILQLARQRLPTLQQRLHIEPMEIPV
jgi:hypothetical protein